MHFYSFPNGRVCSCYACARPTTTYVSGSRSETFKAHNGVRISRPATHYIMPMCPPCVKQHGIKIDSPEKKPASEETPKMGADGDLALGPSGDLELVWSMP